MSEVAAKLIDILLVEDNPGDVRLTKTAFTEANSLINIHVASDGVEAMKFLNREQPFADVPRPDLILLDLNLPRMDGREVLSRLKESESFRVIPTVILTTSDAQSDVLMSYELNANCYLAKPARLDDFEVLVRSINDFWLTQAKLPMEPRNAR